ncbi:ribosome biogenesis regulatory protein homolog [Cyclospora cayetanensis]|uniref:Ribosome biogenesis regulatory protein n=1 Tax=Cyclospora cayetanensis TaxID=88456 RepID=A0A6P6S0E7_9EIME|nr:ribosome biogenesis regulatory protein homolog [Cyclospora cayetanensis]
MTANAPLAVDIASLGRVLPEAPTEADGLTYHLHHLIATDISPLEISTDLEENTQRCAELFVRKLFSLPREASDDGIFVYLPPLPKIDTLRFPRTLKLPSSRPLTRWEAFAKAKGIEKRKRSRLVWSEEVKDWVPRWGPRGLKAIQRQAQGVLEEKGAVTLHSRTAKTKDASAGAAAGGKKRKRVASADAAAAAAAAGVVEDPFKKEKQQRELQKAKQKLREVRNAAEAQAGRGAARAVLKGGSGSARLPPGVPLLSSTQKKHRNKSKEELKELLHR